MDFTIKSDKLVCKISNTGAEIQSVTENGREYIWQADEKYWGGHAPLLFPVCGRLKSFKYTLGGVSYDMPIHGFIKNQSFTVKDKGENYITLTTRANDETKKLYPYDFEFEASYKLKESKLLCTYTIKNHSESDMIYSFGLHPGFNLFCEDGIEINDYRLKFDTPYITSHAFSGFAEKTGKKIATNGGVHEVNEEEIYSNDTLILSDMGNRASLYTDKSEHRIDVEFSESFKHFCVWKYADGSAKYLCLEPWTTIPTDPLGDECFETRYGMLRLSSGKSEVFSLTVNFNS